MDTTTKVLIGIFVVALILVIGFIIYDFVKNNKKVTGACCDSSGNCTQQTSDNCTSPSHYYGDNTTCTAGPSGTCSTLPPNTGACCDASGNCTTTTSALCSSSGGTYKGDGSSCNNSNICISPAGIPLNTPLGIISGTTPGGAISQDPNAPGEGTNILVLGLNWESDPNQQFQITQESNFYRILPNGNPGLVMAPNSATTVSLETSAAHDRLTLWDIQTVSIGASTNFTIRSVGLNSYMSATLGSPLTLIKSQNQPLTDNTSFTFEVVSTTGACCDTSGNCTTTTSAMCSGTYKGNGSSCSDSNICVNSGGSYGQSCNTDANCQSNLYCSFFVCRDGRPRDTCTLDQQCQSGNCIIGFCT